jgi:hypothetical protein
MINEGTGFSSFLFSQVLINGDIPEKKKGYQEKMDPCTTLRNFTGDNHQASNGPDNAGQSNEH